MEEHTNNIGKSYKITCGHIWKSSIIFFQFCNDSFYFLLLFVYVGNIRKLICQGYDIKHCVIFIASYLQPFFRWVIFNFRTNHGLRETYNLMRQKILWYYEGNIFFIIYTKLWQLFENIRTNINKEKSPF